MRIEPKAIVSRLNPTCAALLEAAVAHAASGRFYEIVPEHLLQPLLTAADSDAGAIAGHAQIDVPRVRRRIEGVLGAMRTGNAGRPVFAESVFQWFEDAWLLASLQYGATAIRSGHLLLSFAARVHRYTAEPLPELSSLPVEALRREHEAIVGATRETARAAREATTGAAPATAPPLGDAALTRFTVSWTERARKGLVDPILGRESEIRQLVEILARRRKNNPIIVGEPGVGKTALVEGLARAIVEGDVPQVLRGVEVLELDMGLLHAGAGVRGEFEQRMKAVIAEVKASPVPIVLFIDEAHTVVGKEADAANLLKPALARGELRTIAATTWSEYKKYFEKDAAFARRFQPVKVDEPSEAQTLTMLRGLRETYEAAHGVTIREEALVAAAALSHRYIPGRQLPDKAVDVLDTAATRVRIEQQAKPEALVLREQTVRALTAELALVDRDQREGATVEAGRSEALRERLAAEKDALAGLHAQWQRERDAVIEALRTRSNRSPDAPQVPPASSPANRLVHAEVDAEVVAQVVSTWTGVPVGKLRSDTVGALLGLDEVLATRVRGQAAAVAATAETLRVAAAKLHEPNAPLGVLLFVGPSGVGKTEMAAALADTLYGGDRSMIVTNMSEFQEPHTVSRLIGSPPGYVGFGEGGMLTEAVRQRPHSVVLLDECEKADLAVMNLFYQVFDKGTLADGEGRVIDFKNTLVILTSNLGADAVMRLTDAGRQACGLEELVAAIRPTLSAHFKPALLARMTIVPFMPLPQSVLAEIAALKLQQLADRLWHSHKIRGEFDPEVATMLAERCTTAETGARAVKHILQGSLVPALSRRLLAAVAAGETPTTVRIAMRDGAWDIELR